MPYQRQLYTLKILCEELDVSQDIITASIDGGKWPEPYLLAENIPLWTIDMIVDFINHKVNIPRRRRHNVQALQGELDDTGRSREVTNRVRPRS